MSAPSIKEAERGVLVVGDSGVGKTTLIYRFAKKDVEHKPVEGIDSITAHNVPVNGKTMDVVLWDTPAGMAKFVTGVSVLYRSASGIVVVYDISNAKSFENAGEWIKEVFRNVRPPPCLVLIGNKSDAARQVSTKDGKALADANGAMFFEVSAATGDKVQGAFTALLQKCPERPKTDGAFPLKKRTAPPADDGGCC